MDSVTAEIAAVHADLEGVLLELRTAAARVEVADSRDVRRRASELRMTAAALAAIERRLRALREALHGRR